MKVVLAHNRYSSAQPSGENAIVDLEISQLRAAGVTVLPFLRDSDEIVTLPVAQKALLPASPIYNRQAQRDLGRLIERERPNVVHLHNPYPLLSPWIVRTAHQHHVPVVHTVHNYRQVCVKAVYFRDSRVCTDCRGRVFPAPAVVHSCYRGSRAQSLVMATALAAHRGTWRSVDHYIALTDAIADHLRAYGIPADRITVKPNGVPDPGPAPAEPGTGFVYLARLTEEKGLPLLLDAWRTHPVDTLGPLWILGDGPLRTLAERAAEERADVHFLGQRPAAEVRTTIRSAAVVVVPSVWYDVLPTVVIEALANGRPVLGTNLGGIPYLVGDAGWVVDPTVEAFAAGLAIARETAAERAVHARTRYEADFTPELSVKRLLDVYAEVSS
jgi:glycosyltransferase involved in cell wall biosynthesis